MKQAKLALHVLLFIGILVNMSFARSTTSFPMGGELYRAGDVVLLEIPASYLRDSYTISLWDGEKGQWSQVVTNGKTQIVKWSIPSSLTGKNFRMKLENRSMSVMSDGYFSILSIPLSGISKEIKSNDLATVELSPNPVTSLLHIKVNSNNIVLRQAEIFDVTGRRVGYYELNGNNYLSLGSLKVGSYYLKCIDHAGHILTSRFIVSR